MRTRDFTGGPSIRRAGQDDAGAIFELLHDLAADQGLSHYLASNQEDLARALFGPSPLLSVLVADDGKALIGYVSYYKGFSTFAAKPFGVIDNLFVKPSHRGRRIGERLMSRVAEELIAQHVGRIDLTIISTNLRAAEFYRRLGFSPASETLLQVSGEALRGLSQKI